MKFRVSIAESPEPQNEFVIVCFESDASKQRFKINCLFNPFNFKIRIYDTWEFNLKFRSEVFEGDTEAEKFYLTHFDCDKAIPIIQAQGKYKKS